VIAELSSHAFDSFFAWAPWVVGAIIYAIFYVAKRHESRAVVAARAQTTYACAVCGRRGTLEQMVPQQHGGAIGYRCAQCAASTQPAH
jgi:predicted SprT family Zn-dependent metalloprotease